MTSKQHIRPDLEAISSFALTVPYGRVLLDLCDYIAVCEAALRAVAADDWDEPDWARDTASAALGHNCPEDCQGIHDAFDANAWD